MYIESYNGHNLRHGAWAELMRFTTTHHDCCNNKLVANFAEAKRLNTNILGDRIPAIFTNKNGYIHVTMAIGTNGNTYKDLYLSEKRWYNIVVEQIYKSTATRDDTSTVSQLLFLPNYRIE